VGSKDRRLSYSIAFKIEGVNYAEKHGNRAAERRSGVHEDSRSHTTMDHSW